jgi:hypothetical protein
MTQFNSFVAGLNLIIYCIGDERTAEKNKRERRYFGERGIWLKGIELLSHKERINAAASCCCRWTLTHPNLIIHNPK